MLRSVKEWQNRLIVRSSQVGKGGVWLRSWVFHLGAELPGRPW